MKILNLLTLIAIFSLTYSDSVDCSQIQGSIFGKIVSCTSTQPFPLKVTSTITLSRYYAFDNKSWNFFLRNYKGQMTKVNGCIINNPTFGEYGVGQNLTIGITCYQLPRQLAQGDYIHINFFAQQSASYKLIYLIPILGYSQIQNTKQNFQLEQLKNNKISNHHITIDQQQQTSTQKVNEVVECQRIIDSTSAYYVNCTSTKPFPLKITTTITLLKDQFIIFESEFYFWLRQAKGQIMKIKNCTISRPPNKQYSKGDNITIGITCYELPRDLKQYDSIQVQWLNVYKLIYLIPIPGYNQDLQPLVKSDKEFQQIFLRLEQTQQ